MRSASDSLNAFSRVGFASASKCAATGPGAARHLGLGSLDAPRLVGNAAECHAPGAVALHDRGHRDQRKGIGSAVAHLAIDLRAADRFRQRHRGDQFALPERRLDLRRLAGEPVKLRDRDGSRGAVGLHRFHGRIERAHRHRHVARMRRDAGVARAHHRVLAAETADGGAAAAGLAFVAGLVGVIEIRAARSLQQIARSRCHVAELG